MCCLSIGTEVWPVFKEAPEPICFLQVVRLSSQDVPTAYAYELEAATIVQPEQVIEAVQKVVSGAPALAYA